MSAFDKWVGRAQSVTDVLEPARSNALRVALGSQDGLVAGDPLPLLYHWLYFWDVRPPSGLGADGHPAKGGFLPPVPLPRRMWAGGRVGFHAPLRLGEAARKTSTIAAITEKRGSSGTLLFVTVRHEIFGAAGLAVSEEQDLVYREAASAGLPLPVPDAPPPTAWHREIMPDPVLLFRYSALTMNGHRIHYDRPYAVEQEAYPGLVVHGPLQATLLIELAQAHCEKPVASFAFRGQGPAFGGIPLHLCGEPEGDGARLWTQQGAAPAMTASVVVRA